MAAPDWPSDIPDLPTELAQLVAQIPCGRVATYGSIARALGDIAAAKWIARQLSDPAFAADVPAQRVVRQNGDPGTFHDPTPDAQLQQLCVEDVSIVSGRVDMKRHAFDAFTGSQPLQRLAAQQEAIMRRFHEQPFAGNARLVAAVDVAYPETGIARAAYVLFDASADDVVHCQAIREPVRFPYISGYLAFRELPAYRALWSNLPSDLPAPDVLLVDGNGILHPRRCGIAVQMGVLTNQPTIGVAKKLLTGNVNAARVTPTTPQPVVTRGDDGIGPIELPGMALCSGPDSRPVFVSPGQHMNVSSAVRIVQSLFRDHRLPEPLFLADQTSKQPA